MSNDATAHTRVAAVIGDPVRHSLSPAIYNAAFAAAELDWVFVAFEVREGGAAVALQAMRALDIDWFSVTMPHKTAIAHEVDETSADAAALDAVNCVVNRKGVLRGENTDGEGFLRAVEHSTGFTPSGRSCAVLGAGGAARAVVRALASAGAAEVVVVNRTPAKAEIAVALAGRVGRVGVAADLAQAELIVNATSIGMARNPGLPLDPDLLRPHQIVADLIYEPVVTPLLASAAERGLTHTNGLGMLVHQAALQFERVLGQSAPLGVMLKATEQGLAAL